MTVRTVIGATRGNFSDGEMLMGRRLDGEQLRALLEAAEDGDDVRFQFDDKTLSQFVMAVMVWLVEVGDLVRDDSPAGEVWLQLEQALVEKKTARGRGTI